MNAIIDLNSEVLVDRSQFANPYVRLLLTALGEELAEGSPWVAVHKSAVAEYAVLRQLIQRSRRTVAA